MNLTKKQINTLYQIILDSMEKIDRKTPVGYIETLQELELIFSNEFDLDDCTKLGRGVMFPNLKLSNFKEKLYVKNK